MSENRDEDAIITFNECMEFLVTKVKVFTHEILGDRNGNTTGYTCQTSVMRDNFVIFGSVVPIHAMER